MKSIHVPPSLVGETAVGVVETPPPMHFIVFPLTFIIAAVDIVIKTSSPSLAVLGLTDIFSPHSILKNLFFIIVFNGFNRRLVLTHFFNSGVITLLHWSMLRGLKLFRPQILGSRLFCLDFVFLNCRLSWKLFDLWITSFFNCKKLFLFSLTHSNFRINRSLIPKVAKRRGILRTETMPNYNWILATIVKRFIDALRFFKDLTHRSQVFELSYTSLLLRFAGNIIILYFLWGVFVRKRSFYIIRLAHTQVILAQIDLVGLLLLTMVTGNWDKVLNLYFRLMRWARTSCHWDMKVLLSL